VVTPPEDPQALADAIRGLCDDPARRDRMAVRGRDLIEREYSWKSIVEKWLAECGQPPA
jgi:glycosyltransferase involved in cell wall biosynthesis